MTHTPAFAKTLNMKQEQTSPVPVLSADWPSLRAAAETLRRADDTFAAMLDDVILGAETMTAALGRLLAVKLTDKYLSPKTLETLYAGFAAADATLNDKILRDLDTILNNDPAAHDVLRPFLFFKGFHALQSYRLAHHLWHRNRQPMALYLQNRMSDLFAVDIHPAAQIGSGIMFDHATGIVIGETAVVEDDVLFWHGVTLGGRAPMPTDRHPKIRQGAQLGAGATILGNIEIGAGAKIAAGSTVVHDVPAGATVAGLPAKPL